MKPLKYTGSVTQDGDGFTVRVDLTFSTKDEARTTGEWLHKAIVGHVEGHGGALKPIVPKQSILRPGDIVFLS